MTSAFWGLIVRDARVLRRGLVQFVVRALMQPFLFVFVFAYLFPKIGQGFSGGHAVSGHGTVSFATVLVPGLIAVAAVFTGITAVGLPLSVELGYTREIEDRVLAPVPIWLVAFEKVVFGAVQSLLSAVLVFPLVTIVPATPVSVHVSNWFVMVAEIFLACFLSGSLGLALGTIVKPEKIGLMFAVLVLPLTMLGCVYYPWESLHPVRWLQILVLVNPLVYLSEGLRDALTPSLPHMPVWAFLTAASVAVVALFGVGMKMFFRRVVS